MRGYNDEDGIAFFCRRLREDLTEAYKRLKALGRVNHGRVMGKGSRIRVAVNIKGKRTKNNFLK